MGQAAELPYTHKQVPPRNSNEGYVTLGVNVFNVSPLHPYTN